MNPNTPVKKTPRRRCKPPDSVGYSKQPDLPNWSRNIPRNSIGQTPMKTRDGEKQNPTKSRTHREPDLPSSTFILQETSPKEGIAESPTTSAVLPLLHAPTALRSIKSSGSPLRRGPAGKSPEKETTGS
jgi:hypothetical protein